jgi:hypothetical protein
VQEDGSAPPNKDDAMIDAMFADIVATPQQQEDSLQMTERERGRFRLLSFKIARTTSDAGQRRIMFREALRRVRQLRELDNTAMGTFI